MRQRNITAVPKRAGPLGGEIPIKFLTLILDRRDSTTEKAVREVSSSKSKSNAISFPQPSV